MSNKTIRILLIEDSPTSTLRTQKMVAGIKSTQFNVELECVDQLSKGLSRIAKGDIDVVLLDLVLPDSEGIDTFFRVQKQAPELAIVLLSNLDDDTATIEAVEHGAQDYLVKKEVNSKLLMRSIFYAVERKKVEEELRKYRDYLEKKGAELEQANIRLQELDRLKSMFIASMSHELRTPLNSIIGFTGIILQGISGEITKEQRKELTVVKNSAHHLLALINDVIDVSKIEAGKVELLIEEFNLTDLMQEVNDSFKVAVDEKGLKLSLETPEELIIKSDERRTKQVIMNFVSNAVKFTDRGEIAIKVAKKDGRVEVSVADTGIGIKKENIEKLFRQFSRIYVEGRPIIEGTGLGLYLSKKIANLLGGQLKAESEFGKGSVFIFTLPLKYMEEKNAKCSQSKKSSGSGG